MTPRERFLETILFGKPDRIPLMPGGGRESTRARWHKEGLPENLENLNEINAYAYKLAGGALPFCNDYGGIVPVDHTLKPHFEKKVIEKKERTQIVQDWKGNICEISNEYTVDYLGGENARGDFVTRRWIKCPVENRNDWEKIKTRYNPDDPARFPENPEQVNKKLIASDGASVLHFSGPFWQLREWVGFENLCMMFYDDPKLVQDMLDFWKDFVSQLLEKALRLFKPDIVHLAEDMAYKNFSMISPRMVRKYILPSYQQWGEILRAAHVPVYEVDSDGFLGELIPIWIEAGINHCSPIEVAAGNDINEFQKQFGKKMAYSGSIDKRAMAAGGKVIEDEMKRNGPAIEAGGFIPTCDHGIPPDISWPDYVYFMKLLAAATGWL
ncbi:MAG: uroporphyrinogen decarboxylase family protein [Planctomycetota bacterium]